MFLKPGRHDFYIFYQGKQYYNRHLIDVRKEEIPANMVEEDSAEESEIDDDY